MDKGRQVGMAARTEAGWGIAMSHNAVFLLCFNTISQSIGSVLSYVLLCSFTVFDAFFMLLHVVRHFAQDLVNLVVPKPNATHSMELTR